MKFKYLLLVVLIVLCSAWIIAQEAPETPAPEVAPVADQTPEPPASEPITTEPTETPAPETAPEVVSEAPTEAPAVEPSPEAPAPDVAPVTEATPETPAEVSTTETPTEPEPEADPTQSIVAINFVGNDNINDEALNNAISTRVGDTFDVAKIQQDINSIAAMGVFSAITYKKEDRAGGVAITFDLIENPRVSTIVIENSDPLSEAEVKEVLQTKEGLLFNENTIRSDFRAIRELYAEKGYLAYVTEDADIDPDTGVLTIPILVYKVGVITVSGNKKTKDYVILREMQLKPGDYYNVITLRNKDYPRIYDLGFFETINDPEPEEGEEGTININIPVVEKNTGSFNIGIGYSSSKKLVGTIRVSDTNFMGTGKGVSALWEQGTRYGFKGKGSWELGYNDPWIDSHNTNMSIQVYNKLVYRFTNSSLGGSALSDDVNYGERHQGSQISFTRPYGREKQSSFMIGLKYDNVETNPNYLYEDEMWRIIQNGAVTAATIALENDTRDLRLNPKQGTFKSISAEVGHIDGSEYVPSDFDKTYYKAPFDGTFWKSVAEFRYYHALRKKNEQELMSSKDMRPTIAFRLRGGIGGGELPFFEQFFVGGTDTLRGYDDDRFWGKYLAAGSVEYRHPVFDYLTMVGFVDFGDAWGNEKFLKFKDLEQSLHFKMHFGYGIGGRFNTPLGAMRLDWGFGDEGNKLHFSMGHSF